MALTKLQRSVCKLIAAQRIASDVDLFHDTEEALDASWTADRAHLVRQGFDVVPLRERPSFVEAEVRRDGESVLLQWVRDSAYRFFPLVEDPNFGLALHPFDLATNKVLALVGRLEVRDWVDAILCNDNLQGLGYLAWAACGKDPGFSPASILEQAARSSHYSAAEVASLSFEGTPPDAGELSRRWRTIVQDARLVVNALPAQEAGKCVLARDGRLLAAEPEEIARLLHSGELRFHAGSICGALPRLM